MRAAALFLFFCLLVPCTKAQEPSLKLHRYQFFNDTLPDGRVVNQRDDHDRPHGLYIFLMSGSRTGPLTPQEAMKKESFEGWQQRMSSMGEYEHGCPIGTWTMRHTNGSFQKGSYSCTNDRASMVHDGPGSKIGTWTFYAADSTISKEEKYTYARRGAKRIDSTFYVGREGRFEIHDVQVRKGHSSTLTTYFFAGGKVKRKVKESHANGNKEEWVYNSTGHLEKLTIEKPNKNYKLSKSYNAKGKRIYYSKQVGIPPKIRFW